MADRARAVPANVPGSFFVDAACIDCGACRQLALATFGDGAIAVHPEFRIIPTPGHTRGHCVLLHRDYLFTGDHLDFDPRTGRLAAWKSVCWYSWSKQLEVIAKLRSYEFSWVLPGHGRRAHQAPAEMRRQLDLILERAA
jgi:glyoxylase-like metal-dependent hydrolase (beta-lactamase superfamily II)